MKARWSTKIGRTNHVSIDAKKRRNDQDWLEHCHPSDQDGHWKRKTGD